MGVKITSFYDANGKVVLCTNSNELPTSVYGGDSVLYANVSFINYDVKLSFTGYTQFPTTIKVLRYTNSEYSEHDNYSINTGSTIVKDNFTFSDGAITIKNLRVDDKILLFLKEDQIILLLLLNLHAKTA